MRDFGGKLLFKHGHFSLPFTSCLGPLSAVSSCPRHLLPQEEKFQRQSSCVRVGIPILELVLSCSEQFEMVVRHNLALFARQSSILSPEAAPESCSTALPPWLQCFWGAALVEPLLCELLVQVLPGAQNLFSSAEEDKPQSPFLSSLDLL